GRAVPAPVAAVRCGFRLAAGRMRRFFVSLEKIGGSSAKAKLKTSFSFSFALAFRYLYGAKAVYDGGRHSIDPPAGAGRSGRGAPARCGGQCCGGVCRIRGGARRSI